MKIKVLLLALGCSFSAFSAFAQKGVDNGSRYGSGEDSVRCITNISLFVPYAKAGNFKDAYEFWKIVYDECPASTKDIYLYGARILNWQIANEKDAVKKDALIDQLMALYDQRVKYFGEDKKYGKNWIVGRKAQDYITLKGQKADFSLVNAWTKEVLDEYKENTESLAISLYMFSSFQEMQKDPNNKEKYINDYMLCSGYFDTQIAAAGGNEKKATALKASKTVLDNTFAQSGAADCETLQSMYAAKVDANITDIDFLKETLSLLKRVRCQEIEAFFTAAEAVHKVEPTASSALGCAKRAVKNKDYDLAITYFEEAITLEEEAESKADYYYMIAMLSYEKNQYSKARQYALKAVEANPALGAPYILIGNMYVATAKSIYPGDALLSRTVYYAAVDKFEKAKQVDPSLAADANKLIYTYRAHFPSSEDVFLHPDLEKGKIITIGGWIGEQTRVR
jgi:tetratricopeptide (TPR) repeat protein